MPYPISAPVVFDNSAGSGQILDFTATGTDNVIKNFVATAAGDLIFRKAGADNVLDRLPVGADGDMLSVVAGLPAWVKESDSRGVFHARVEAKVADIPSSCAGAIAPGIEDQFFDLNNAFVTWAAPVDPDLCFDATLGIFTAPDAGWYAFSAQVTFDSGNGTNGGSGLTGAFKPGGKATRQIRLVAPGDVELAVGVTQASPGNDNHVVAHLATAHVQLLAGDTIKIQVRHDHPLNDKVSVGGTSTKNQTYFSGKRIK